jgi:hypothetical protein
VGLSGAQSLHNGFDDGAGIAQDIVVPESDHPPPLAFQPRCSSRIGRTVRMLTPIDFDHQPVLGAGEIDDVGADRLLPTKTVFY